MGIMNMPRVHDVQLPSRLQEAQLIATIAVQTSGKLDKAKFEAVSRQGLPLREVTVAARGTDPIQCGSFDGYLWGTSALVTNAVSGA